MPGCEAAHLTAEIQARKQAFDGLNISVLERLLQHIALRPGQTNRQRGAVKECERIPSQLLFCC